MAFMTQTIEEECSTSDDDEHNVNFCFMAKDDDKVNFSYLSHEELLEAFDDLLINSKTILSKCVELNENTS